jgi:hypothetical protein
VLAGTPEVIKQARVPRVVLLPDKLVREVQAQSRQVANLPAVVVKAVLQIQAVVEDDKER